MERTEGYESTVGAGNMQRPRIEIHPLVGAPFRQGVLTLADWRSLRLSGWFGFTLVWEHEPDHYAAPPVFRGIYSRGGKGVAPWADVEFHLELACPLCGTVCAPDEPAAVELFSLWCRVIPWNGHLSVAYEDDEHEETLQGLKIGVPPVLTPLGFAGYLAGFIGGFKDWYIAEGGHEGPRKLQMNKPLNLEHAERVYQEMQREVTGFMDRWNDGKDSRIRRKAAQRASRWMPRAERMIHDLFR